MASACVTNNIGDNNFLDCPPGPKYSPIGWLSPRVSLSSKKSPEKKPKPVDLDSESPVKDSLPVADFEFRLDDSVTMLPADELFSDGKLVPLHLSNVRPSFSATTTTTSFPALSNSPECRRKSVAGGELNFSNDAYLFSPKAPRCSSRWRELLGLKKKQQQENNAKTSSLSTSAPSTSSAKSIRLFLHRNSKTSTSSFSSSSDQTLNLPLLRADSESSESLSISSSRLSLSSSSSSGHDHDDLPRLSLDSEKPKNPPRVRMARPSTAHGRVGRSPMRKAQQDPTTMTRGVSVDSPRMNPSGKVIFQSLERSSSSPSSFNGGRPRYNNRPGMERSYSANVVRITPVLNVPVCSSLRGSSKSGVFGFGQLFSGQAQKKDSNGNNNNGGNTNMGNRHNHHHYQNISSRNNKKEVQN